MTALIRGACCTFGLLLLLACTAGTAQNQLPTVFTTCDTVKLADGIYALMPAEDASAFVRGNSVLIFGSDGRSSSISGHVPSVTKRMIADITRLANQPVRSSTTTGIPTHHRQHPLSRPVARRRHREHARRAVRAHAADLLYDDLTEMCKYMPQLEQALASDKGAGGKSLTDGERAYYTEILSEAKSMQPDLVQTPKAPPTVTFDQQMLVDLGRRKVEISFLGRGNTGGDTVIDVPDAKVLMTGDLLVAPTPFAISPSIDEGIVTMKALAAHERGTKQGRVFRRSTISRTPAMLLDRPG